MVKLFTGKESKREEDAEARALKSGKITKKQYAAGEKREDKKAKKKG
jgi:hypothetical protein